MDKAIDVFWTGGWDSSYRVLYASVVEKRLIKPHYIIDFGRKSSLRELEAISDIRRKLEKIDPEAAKRIGEIKITPITEIADIPEVTESFNRLKKQAHLGSQYDWLSRYATSHNIDDLELSVHVDDKAYFFLEGRVKQGKDGRWRMRDDAEGDVRIFSCLTFPLLQISKTEMREQAQKHDFIDALEKAWFCFNPKKGKPCGVCNPCIYAVEEGMGYRLSGNAMLNYRTRHIRKIAKAPGYVSRNIYRKAKGQ
ncbi:7-cyano-7-deazaguanine synthase [Halomonas korlensis]|uniref:7-cyano-7-deazaguanine synthase (Queuosine biosynthesis) n=1 Tax=Halomonas korlensis TaxID=463301 RepID=A0A1I7K843_9GAMM|nr:7-cyano-7-deazaguanine synthase [Halomonas korlensis]SFU93623.1 7-cyano-7-deazaguanine synthase (queuosine biosynthesis) [Halomonas korlensis]